MHDIDCSKLETDLAAQWVTKLVQIMFVLVTRQALMMQQA